MPELPLMHLLSMMKKGKKVTPGVQPGRHEGILAPGDTKHKGTHHAETPAHSQKISSERLAETVLHNERSA